MNVSDLAPALLAFGNLCEQANRELNGDRGKVEVKIRTFAPGSVIVDLLIYVSIISTLLHGPAKTANELLDIVKKGIEITKLLGGDKVTSVTKIDDNTTQLTTEHKHVHDVSDRVYALLKNRTAQRDMLDIVRPLQNDGIDRLKMIENKVVVETVEAVDVPAFAALPSSMPLPEGEVSPQEITSTVVGYYRVISLSSDPRHVWRLSNGSETISVTVADHELHQRAAQGGLGIEPGFIVKARIQSETTLQNGDLRTRNTLEEILDVQPPQSNKQQRLL